MICLAAASFFLAACSSTTVVAQDERATASSVDESAEPADAADESEPTDTADSSDDADPGSDSQADEDGDADNERGGREDAEAAGEIDLAEGFGLGGAEQLEGLLGDCQDGNDLACDILFQISAFDSDEENAALTCGGRSDTEVTFCTDGIDADGDGELVFDPDSAGLDRVVEACQVDGNMTACDFLYYRSPIDSSFQEIGGTCGGRVNVAVPDCRSTIEE